MTQKNSEHTIRYCLQQLLEAAYADKQCDQKLFEAIRFDELPVIECVKVGESLHFSCAVASLTFTRIENNVRCQYRADVFAPNASQHDGNFYGRKHGGLSHSDVFERLQSILG